MNYPCSLWEVNDDREKAPIYAEGEDEPWCWTPWYRNVETGEEVTGRELPVGAIWDQAKLSPAYAARAGADGRYLVCKLPGGHHWSIDGRANNCGRPDDDVHRCWVRHGEAPALTVNKEGDTCVAGAGSIQVPDWHGFLRNGVLEEC